MNVVALKTTNEAKKTTRAARRVTRLSRAARRQHGAAAIVGAVAIVLMALSLDHLAAGIALVCHCSSPEAWAMGIGIDAGFVALELASVTAMERTRKKIAGLIHHTLVGLMLVSSALNALAFGLGGEGWLLYVAAVIGGSIPLMVYRLNRVATTMWLS